MLTQVRKKTMEISLLTDIGQKRSNNQDFVNKFVNQAGVTLVVVADGMGGHRAGNIASEMSVTDLGRDWINTDFRELSQIRDWMIAAIDAEAGENTFSIEIPNMLSFMTKNIREWEQLLRFLPLLITL